MMHRALRAIVVTLLISSMVSAARAGARQEEDAWRYMIGLLEIPSALGSFMSTNPAQPAQKRAIKIYSAPTTTSKVIVVIDDPEKIIQAKVSSEELGAVTYMRKNGWYLIGLDNKYAKGWISPADAGRFIPVDKLLIKRLAYLNARWDKRMWSLPERASSSRRLKLKGDRNPPIYDVNITGARMVKRELWLKVEVVGPGRCVGMNEPKIITRGWIPAYTRKGELVAWYYPGGC